MVQDQPSNIKSLKPNMQPNDNKKNLQEMKESWNSLIVSAVFF